MNNLKLKELIHEYKEKFNDTIPYEIYKWKAVKCFQDNWDIDAKDFSSMLKSSLLRTRNLLAFMNNFPGKMIRSYAESYPEEVRSLFKMLYDESQDLVIRIESFIEGIKYIHSKWDIDGNKNHFQSYTVISIYLWLRFPDKYYIYKPAVAKKIFKEINGKELFAKKAEAVIMVYKLYDEISEMLMYDSDLRHMLKNVMTSDCYPDHYMKTATVDFVYSISKPIKFSIAGKRENKKIFNVDNYKVMESVPVPIKNKNYWWLNANPKVWSMSEWVVGDLQDYTLFNDNGNKRRIYQNFIDAKEGDIVVCYESNPTKQILGLAEVAKANDGEKIMFRKTETLSSPIDFSTIKEIAELRNMEFLVNPNGSFFKLTCAEYEIIIDLIRESNKLPDVVPLEKYSKSDFLNEVFMDEKDYYRLSHQLKVKKNVILQGAPGVGKTFSAKRLAYSVMGVKDDSRICFIQFHQNYSYEDFIMGYRPVEDKFILRKGIFYDFCTLAKNNRDKDYFFIIDEINRGNLSKIFGELLMLIEKDYRGEKNKMTLAYTGEKFYVPENLYIIGMMNTADRSLAMIDYALRRRFSFFNIKPGFETEGFKRKCSLVTNPKLEKLVRKIIELNKKIIEDDSLGSGFEIGHSYLCFKNPVDVTDDFLRGVVEYDIIPMLEEYWFDNKNKVNEWSEKLKSALND